MYKKYSEKDKEIFFRCLDIHKNSIQNGDACTIVLTGIKLHRAYENAPKSYVRYIKQARRALKLKIKKETK